LADSAEEAHGRPTSIGDTARMVAFYRALESERADALFHDPYARRLAGARGERLVQLLASVELASAVVAQRTAVFDELLLRAVTVGGVDAILNLGAGLDARAYRLPLPRSVRWLDVDLPKMVADRQAVFRRETAHCQVETIALDLADRPARQVLFTQLNADRRRVLVVTEGLLLYLAPAEVASLAADLYAQSSFAGWLTDLMSPMAASRMQRAVGPVFAGAGATLRFAPGNGPAFFRTFGWHAAEVRLSLAEARRLGRPLPLPRLLSLVLRLAALRQVRGELPLDATVLLTRSSSSAGRLDLPKPLQHNAMNAW
jgi:methyltransferase (TIGR00027 family)